MTIPICVKSVAQFHDEESSQVLDCEGCGNLSTSTFEIARGDNSGAFPEVQIQGAWVEQIFVEHKSVMRIFAMRWIYLVARKSPHNVMKM